MSGVSKPHSMFNNKLMEICTSFMIRQEFNIIVISYTDEKSTEALHSNNEIIFQ